jgi:hypothetical protein
MHLDESGEGSEDLQGWRESEGENTEAEEPALPPKAHVLPGGMVERDVKIGVPQVDGRCPIAWPEEVLHCLHAPHSASSS